MRGLHVLLCYVAVHNKVISDWQVMSHAHPSTGSRDWLAHTSMLVTQAPNGFLRRTGRAVASHGPFRAMMQGMRPSADGRPYTSYTAFRIHS